MSARSSWQRVLPLIYYLMTYQLASRSPFTDGATIDVMWLVSRQTYYDVSATSSIGALALAVNSATVNSSDTYKILWADPKCDKKGAVIAMYQSLIEKRYMPRVIIGPPCSDAMIYVGQLAGFRNLPSFGWVSESTDLQDKSRYNTMTRVYPPINSFAGGVVLLLDKFNWQTVYIISSKTTRYSQLGTAIATQLNGLPRFNVTKWSTLADDDDTSISGILTLVASRARIVLLCVPQSKLRAWMTAVYDASMATGQYAFIYVDPDLQTPTAQAKLTSQSLWQQNSANDSRVKQALQSTLILTSSPQDADAINTFGNKALMAASTSSIPAALNIIPQPTDQYAPFLHDAFLLYTVLSREALKAGQQIDNGIDLFRRAVVRKFTRNDANWATGDKLIMDENGDRQPDFWLWNLGSGSVYVPAMKIVYDLSNGNIFSTVLNVADIIWGNGQTGDANRPADNPTCGFSNEMCPNYGLYVGVPVTVVCLIATGVAVFFAIRHRNFEQSLNNMAWRLKQELLIFAANIDINAAKDSVHSLKMLVAASKDAARRRSSIYSDSLHHQAVAAVAAAAAADGSTVEDSTSVGQLSHHGLGVAGQTFTETAVYRNAVVAVKRLTTKRLNLSRDLMIEMLHMTDMKHRNVATFIGATTDPPEIFEVWEYCAKGSLQDIIWDERITLDNMFKFSVVIDVLKGLKYLHESPIKKHGKLKSSNVVVDGRWTCKLTDYGLETFYDALDGGGRVVLDATGGKVSTSEDKKYSQLQWTAPELLRAMNPTDNRRISTLSNGSDVVTPRTKGQVKSTPEADIYAMAIILKEVFARNGPYTEYEEMTSREIIERIRDVPVDKSVSLMRPVLPTMEDRNLEKLLGTMRTGWCERPQDRPNVGQMLKDVQRINPFKSTNMVDNMIQLMERYSNHLEDMVAEKTIQVTEEKRKSEALLFRMLPMPVAEKLKVGETVDAEAFNAVTIYFSDIVKFTVLSAESTPLQVVTLLNALYTVFDSTIARHDVYKVETIGDAYMLVSGLPVRNDDRHAVEIANCAMELLSGIANFKVPHKPGYKLQLRIGLHTGPVVAGVVGTTMPRYCLFGATVGRASSMESGGLPMRIHISEHMYEILSKFPGYHLALRGCVHDMPGIGLIKSYWLYNRDGYNRPLPDFNQQMTEDNPPPEILPITVGVPSIKATSPANAPAKRINFSESVDENAAAPKGTAAGIKELPTTISKYSSNVVRTESPESQKEEPHTRNFIAKNRVEPQKENQPKDGDVKATEGDEDTRKHRKHRRHHRHCRHRRGRRHRSADGVLEDSRSAAGETDKLTNNVEGVDGSRKEHRTKRCRHCTAADGGNGLPADGTTSGKRGVEDASGADPSRENDEKQLHSHHRDHHHHHHHGHHHHHHHRHRHRRHKSADADAVNGNGTEGECSETTTLSRSRRRRGVVDDEEPLTDVDGRLIVVVQADNRATELDSSRAANEESRRDQPVGEKLFVSRSAAKP